MPFQSVVRQCEELPCPGIEFGRPGKPLRRRSSRSVRIPLAAVKPATAYAGQSQVHRSVYSTWTALRTEMPEQTARTTSWANCL